MKFFVNTLFIGFSLLTIACGTSKKESRSNTNTASNDISVDLSQAFNNENDFGLVKGIESERLYMLIDQNQKVYMTMECKNEDAPKSIASYYLSYNLKKLKDVLKNGDDFVLRLTSPAGTEAHPDYQCEVSVRLEHAYEGFKRAEPIFIAQTTFAKATKKLNYQLSDKLKEKMETLPMLVKVQSVQGNRAQLSDVVGSNSGLDLYAYCHNPTSDSKHYEFAMYVKKGLTLDEFLNGSDGIKLDYIKNGNKKRWIKDMECTTWVSQKGKNIFVQNGGYQPPLAAGTVIPGNFILTDELQKEVGNTWGDCRTCQQ